jgi:hypothetical protein
MSKYIFIMLLLSFVVSTTYGKATHQPIGKNHLPLDVMPGVKLKTPQTSLYFPNKVIIRLKDTYVGGVKQSYKVSAAFSSFLTKYSVQSLDRMFPKEFDAMNGRQMDMSKFLLLQYGSPMDAFKVAQEISKNPEVLYAEPWFRYKVNDGCAPPNDTLSVNQWYLNTIKMDSAWCHDQGDTSIVIGIIDTGVFLLHPDLAPNIYINPGETGLDSLGRDKRFNGVDDDHDGYIDDWHGWDFGGADYNNPIGRNDPDPRSTGIAGHGTFVGGIASAATNNVIGISGIGYKCRIMAVKVNSDNDSDNIDFGFQGMIYAARLGAKVINCSWGGAGGASQFEQEMIDSTTSLGALVVCAAGNDGLNEAFYPAGYNNVVAVAGTQFNDQITSYSNYGPYVTVSAPGGDGFEPSTLIYSTVYDPVDTNSYGLWDGTSFSSPQVAGVAALVAHHFPSYTPKQVGEQVRATCDDITSVNQSQYAYMLGRGRINAFKALTVSTPSVRITNIAVKDTIVGNGNGIIQPGETFALVMNFTNYLQPTSDLTVSINTTDPAFGAINATSNLGVVGTNQTVSNASNPFVWLATSNLPPSDEVTFIVTFKAGSYSDFQAFTLLANPTFATQGVNNVQVTLMNNGRIGFNDYPNNTQGVGFVYQGGNQLFEGGLILGTDATHVVDVVRDNSQEEEDDDLTSDSLYTILQPGPIAPQEGYATYTDATADPSVRLGVSITQHSFEFSTKPDTNYIILRYDITNTSGTTISNLHFGIFTDWDVINYATNLQGYDATRHMGYAWDDSVNNSVYVGVRALDSSATSFYGLINTQTIDMTKSSKWNWISSGVVPNDTLGDIMFTTGSGPFTIKPGARRRVAFALVAGTSLANLQLNADYAASKWQYIEGIEGVPVKLPGIPKVFALKQNYPNPFNPSTTISYDLPTAALVSLKVFNVLGQELATLVNRQQTPGSYSIRYDASQLGSGVYFYQLTATDDKKGQLYSSVKKLLLLK